MSLVILILMYAVWASVFSLGKIALTVSPPLFLTGVRMLIAGLLLLGYLLWRNRSAFKVSGKQLLSCAVLALFSVYLTNICEFWGLKHMTAAKTCFFYSLTPFFSALFSYLHFGEKMTSRKWMGMGVGFTGFLPVLFAQKGAEELLSTLTFISWPELAIIGASIFSGYGWVLMRRLVKNQSMPLLLVNGSSMVIGGIFALIHSSLVDSWTPLPVASSDLGKFAQGISILILISNILCVNLYGLMLKRFTATFLSFMGLLFPIFASMHGWFFLGEPFSFTILLSTGIVSIGLWLFYSAELRQGYIYKRA